MAISLEKVEALAPDQASLAAARSLLKMPWNYSQTLDRAGVG
ncbi:MAG: hypothetical protein ACK527_08440 [Acidobacteriota bacterium]